MEKEDKIKVFQEQINSINNITIQNLVMEALNNVNDEFFKAPASSTGKYHPEYSLGEGGLVRHTISAVWFANTLWELEQNKINNENWLYERDLIIASLILHDTCKSGINFENKYTVHDHPLLVKDLLSEQELNEDEIKKWNEINDIISSHMGEWNTNDRSSIILPKPTTKLQKFMHMCDFLASRRELDLKIFNL